LKGFQMPTSWPMTSNMAMGIKSRYGCWVFCIDWFFSCSAAADLEKGTQIFDSFSLQF